MSLSIETLFREVRMYRAPDIMTYRLIKTIYWQGISNEQFRIQRWQILLPVWTMLDGLIMWKVLNLLRICSTRKQWSVFLQSRWGGFWKKLNNLHKNKNIYLNLNLDYLSSSINNFKINSSKKGLFDGLLYTFFSHSIFS